MIRRGSRCSNVVVLRILYFSAASHADRTVALIRGRAWEYVVAFDASQDTILSCFPNFVFSLCDDDVWRDGCGALVEARAVLGTDRR